MKWSVTLLMGATIFRTQTIFFVSTVEAFGGPSPNAWFGPWVSDAVIGLLVPVMIFVLWTKHTPRAWGALVTYNSLGAFDYSHGLLTQFFHPVPVEIAPPMTVYLGIGVFMVLQLVAIGLLFRRSVVAHFWADPDDLSA
ncbi:MAG: hypothetical protein AAGA28_08110 [Pseudomonadota bacterium]